MKNKSMVFALIQMIYATSYATEHRIEAPECIKDYEYLITVTADETKTGVEWVVPVYRTGAIDRLQTSKADYTPTKAVPPRYPVMAARDGIEGAVCYVFDLDEQARIGNLRAYDTQPKKIFDVVATAAFVQWQFEALKAGTDPELRKNVRYCLDFKLED